MSYPAQIKIPNIIRGDGWSGVVFGPIEVGETVDTVSVPDEDLERVEVVFWLCNDRNQIIQHRYDSDDPDSGLTITNSNTWVSELQLDSRTLPAGSYEWAARFTADGWGPYTLFRGPVQVVSIIPEI